MRVSEWSFSAFSQHCPKLLLRAHLMLGHVAWLSPVKEDPSEPCPDRCPLLVAGALSGQLSLLLAYTWTFRQFDRVRNAH